MQKLPSLKIALLILIGLSFSGERVSGEQGIANTQETAALELSSRPALFRPIEVRTRRLHLVRPDLLRYPIQYDTFC